MKHKMNIFASIVINAPAEKVWEELRDFIASAHWHELVSKAFVTNHKEPDEVGVVRFTQTKYDERYIEKLVSRSDEEMWYTYHIIEAPIAVENFVGKVQLYPVTEGNMTFAMWSTEFETHENHIELMEEVVGDGICAGGLQALKVHFEDKDEE